MGKFSVNLDHELVVKGVKWFNFFRTLDVNTYRARKGHHSHRR